MNIIKVFTYFFLDGLCCGDTALDAEFGKQNPHLGLRKSVVLSLSCTLELLGSY